MAAPRAYAFADRQVDAAVGARNHSFRWPGGGGRRVRGASPVLAHDPENEEKQREKKQVFHDVITSYSIHYTKLYDVAISIFVSPEAGIITSFASLNCKSFS